MAFSERLQVIIDAHGGGAIREFQKVGSEAKKAYDQVGKSQSGAAQSTGRLQKALNTLGVSSSTALKAAIVAGVAAAGVAVERFVSGSIRAYVHYGAEVRRVQRITGATAEDSSRLAVAFKTLGIDVDRGGNALFRFLKNVEVNGKGLKSLGVQVVRNKQGIVQTVPTLVALADAYARTTSPSKRAELAAAAFGARIGADLLPALSKGGAGLESMLKAADRFGLVLSSQDLQATLNYTLATRHLGEAVEGLKIQTGRSFVGVGTGLAEFGTATVIGLQKEASGLGKIVSHVPGVNWLSHAIHDLATETQNAGRALQGPLASLPKLLQESLATSQGQVKMLTAERSAALGVDVAKHNLARAEHALSVARGGGNNAARDAIRMAREERDAQIALADAQRGVIDAQKRLADLQQGPSQHDLTQAGFDQREAQLGLAEAQQEYADANSEATPSVLRIQRASLSLAEAQQRLADANNEVSDLQKQNAADVESAQRDLQSAQDRVTDAQDRFNEAMQRTADEAPDVQGALLAVRGAQLQLLDAQAASRDTTQQLNDLLNQINDIDAGNIKSQLTDTLALLQSNDISAQNFLDRLREIEVMGSSHSGAGGVDAGGFTEAQRDAESRRVLQDQARKRQPVAPSKPVNLPGYDVPSVFGDVPRFAAGGVMPGPVGKPGVAILHGGERVIPNGGGAVSVGSINVYAPTSNADDIVDAVHQALIRKMRRSGSLGLN